MFVTFTILGFITIQIVLYGIRLVDSIDANHIALKYLGNSLVDEGINGAIDVFDFIKSLILSITNSGDAINQDINYISGVYFLIYPFY